LRLHGALMAAESSCRIDAAPARRRLVVLCALLDPVANEVKIRLRKRGDGRARQRKGHRAPATSKVPAGARIGVHIFDNRLGTRQLVPEEARAKTVCSYDGHGRVVIRGYGLARRVRHEAVVNRRQRRCSRGRHRWRWGPEVLALSTRRRHRHCRVPMTQALAWHRPADRTLGLEDRHEIGRE